MSNTPRVFISHGLEEAEFASEVSEALAGMGVTAVEPSSRMLESQNFGTSLGNSLKSADGMVVLLTPHSGDSQILRREVSYALNRVRFRNRVVPVILGATKNFPWILRRLNPIEVKLDPNAVAKAVVERLSARRPVSGKRTSASKIPSRLQLSEKAPQ